MRRFQSLSTYVQIISTETLIRVSNFSQKARNQFEDIKQYVQ